MFRNSAAAEPAAINDAPVRLDLVPLSVLALDLPADDWHGYLAARDVPIVVDDVGRDSVRRSDARVLLAEYRERVAAEREAAVRDHERREREAEEQDRARRALIWRGVPASAFPPDASAASVLVAALRESRPKRQSVLDAALSNAGEMTYHSLAPESDPS